MGLNLYVWSEHCSLWADVPLMECSPISGSATEITLGRKSGLLITCMQNLQSSRWSHWLLEHQSHGKRQQNQKQWKIQAWHRWRFIIPSMHSQHPSFCPVSCPVQYNLKFALSIDNGVPSGVEHGLTPLWHLHCVWLFNESSPSSCHSRVTCTPLVAMTWTNSCATWMWKICSYCN